MRTGATRGPENAIVAEFGGALHKGGRCAAPREELMTIGAKLVSRVYWLRMASLVLSAVAVLYAPVARAEAASVRIAVFDDTENEPIPERAEIWIRGLGSWWITKENVRNVSGREVGAVDTMFIYPDGRSGKELSVKFKITSRMCPQGCARDIVSVAVEDAYVVVSGTPIRAATDKFEVKLKRR